MSGNAIQILACKRDEEECLIVNYNYGGKEHQFRLNHGMDMVLKKMNRMDELKRTVRGDITSKNPGECFNLIRFMITYANITSKRDIRIYTTHCDRQILYCQRLLYDMRCMNEWSNKKNTLCKNYGRIAEFISNYLKFI